METMMTVREMAEILRYHQTTVYRLARIGQIPAFRVGGSLRFKPQEVVALLESISGYRAPAPTIELCALPPIPKRAGSREI